MPFKKSIFPLMLCCAFASTTVVSATGNILPDDAFAEADVSSLKAEARLFDRIKDGVVLTLAECELADTCTPSVGSREVEWIIETIDVRITTLIDRYSETNDQELEEALLIYSDAREGYADALEQLRALPGSDDDEDAVGEDDFVDDMESGDFSELFEDADEDLQ